MKVYVESWNKVIKYDGVESKGKLAYIRKDEKNVEYSKKQSLYIHEINIENASIKEEQLVNHKFDSKDRNKEIKGRFGLPDGDWWLCLNPKAFTTEFTGSRQKADLKQLR
jgi:hypothetical protein